MEEKEYEVTVEVKVGPDAFHVVEPVVATSEKDALLVAEQYVRDNIAVLAVSAECTCDGE